MKIRSVVNAALLIVFGIVLRAGDAVRFTPAAAKSETSVTIRGTSSLHEWQMQGTTIAGVIETDPETWKIDGPKSALAKVSIPVASVRSDHDRMDRIMREALKTPEITYEMASSSLLKMAGDSFVVRTSGKLSIAGMTRDVALDVTVQRSGERRYVLTGQTPIRMTDYGIKPPVAMMGTLKTGNDVTVAFRWVLDRS
jgi:polyisoprenoid-binding protein YceI